MLGLKSPNSLFLMCHFHIVNNIPSLDDFLWGIGGQNSSSLYKISLGVEGYTDSLKGLAALPPCARL